MNTMMLVSYLALWVIVLLLVFAIAVLGRQIGLLHERLGPVGARMTNVGPQIGEVIPARTVTDIFGRRIELGGASPKPTFLTFMSALCPSCSDVAPALRSLWRNERQRINFVVISVGGSEAENRDFIARFGLQDMPFVLSPELGIAYKILSPPYGLFLDNTGVVKAKGIVNQSEHLESLLNAADLDEPTMESYMAKRMAGASFDPAVEASK
jgi:methylamine dehydrogenase accessory protein MauD